MGGKQSKNKTPSWPHCDEVFILVMGSTGAGKTNVSIPLFIDDASNFSSEIFS
jgi:predicted GTPase